jgi:uroporphyrin-III C-methyltransferase
LNLVSPAAQLYTVGKRCGTKAISQAEINFIMIALASSGLTVVRLKSGDPMIFGRCGEEIEALRKAGMECEVVPGITAALGAASAAQIPLTHRRVSHALIFLSAHTANDSESVDWNKFISGGATIAVYMPGRNYGELAARLTSAGLEGDTPCAIISSATTPDQEMVVSTLWELPGLASLPTPALLLVGNTVALAQKSAVRRPPGQTQEEHTRKARQDEHIFTESDAGAQTFGIPTLA